MPLFSYKAMSDSGRMTCGRLDAINLVDLEMRLQRLHLDFINGAEVRRGRRFGGRRVARRELINFCFQLAQLLRAGIPILEGLIDLRDSLEHPRFREVIAAVIESIAGGKTLSQALAEHPRVFDRVFTSLVRAGETSGNLAEVLQRLDVSLKWQDELAAHNRKLLMYPALLGLVVSAVFFFMMIYLVPKLVGFIHNLGQQIPLQTRILIQVSDFLVDAWAIVVLLPLASLIVVRLMLAHHPRARRRYDAFKLAIPLLGEILRKLALARFATVFAMMYASGISIVESIRSTEGVVGNTIIRAALARVGQNIADGQQVSAAFHHAGLFPPLLIRMLRVGENTGAVDTALLNISYFYERDVRESIARVQSMMEPVLTLLVGTLLGWVMLAVLGPLYDSIAKLKL